MNGSCLLLEQRALTESQARVVINALYTAAEKYRECAKEIGKHMPPGPGRDSLVGQFKKQADECAELLDALQE
jgi:hypothetical protein